MDEKRKPQVQERVESASASDIDVEIHNEKTTKQLLKKIDWVLLPFLALLYLLSFLDRSNIGNARLAGLESDLNMHGLDYNIALAAFFPPYALAEIPSNIMMKKIRPSIWIASIMVAWGLICLCMGFVKNLGGLSLARAFLGFAEGGLFPGITFFITMWYRRHECGLRMAIFFSAATAAGAFGGLMARAIVGLSGSHGLDGWSWIFIIEGAITLAVAFSAFFLMQDYPETAKFLTEKERTIVKRRLELDRNFLADEYDSKYAWQAVKDWKVYVYSVLGAGIAIPLYSISLFLPTIVKSLKYTNTTAQLMTVPPYVVACALCILGGYAADRAKQRGVFLMGFSLLASTGFLMLIIAVDPRVKYAGCFFACSGIFPMVPQAVAWAGNNFGGSSKRAIAIAIYAMSPNLGGIASGFIYLPQYAPHYRMGHSILLVLTCLSALIALCLHIYFRKENARREAIKPEIAYTDEEKMAERERGDHASFFRYVI